MTPQEIKPRQLRALLLLLFLVPLIPAALMVRFMFDTLKAERLSALDRAREYHTQTLADLFRVAKPAGTTDAERAVSLLAEWQRSADPGVRAQIVDSAGRLLAGAENVWERPVASVAVPGFDHVTMHVHLAGPEALDQSIAEQRQFLYWSGGLTTVAALLIAGTAVLALSRQLTLSELKNTSVATVAHELRTPLASMRMLVDTLREGRVRSEDQRREYLDLIAAENERLSRLAENFLTFSRLERGTQMLQFEPVAPSELAARATSPLKARLDAARFTLEVPEDLPAVRADLDACSQVFTNLLENALKYTGDEKRIALRAAAEGKGVTFRVEDNGVGISAEQKRAIFRPFYQVDQRLSRTREGCGLGLAIVRRIVEAHQGEIDLASEPGKGSVFSVKIPTA